MGNTDWLYSLPDVSTRPPSPPWLLPPPVNSGGKEKGGNSDVALKSVEVEPSGMGGGSDVEDTCSSLVVMGEGGVAVEEVGGGGGRERKETWLS